MVELTNRNATPSVVGFHFQDLVGLMLLLDLEKVKNIKTITIEGEEDIEIKNVDSTLEYYQLKATTKPFEAKMTKPLKDALVSLNDDSVRATENGQDVAMLAYVSNSNKPLGIQKNSEIFAQSYGNYLFADLPIEQQKQITRYLPDGSVIDLDKFHVMKVHFAGSDEQTRRIEVSNKVTEFVGAAGPSAIHMRDLENELIALVSQSAEEKRAVVSKEDLLAHAVVTEIFQTPNWDDFFDRYDVDPGNEAYIKAKYSEMNEFILSNFTVVSVIRRDYNDFIKVNPNLPRRERKIKFVNDQVELVKSRLRLTEERDNDIAKLISEVVITSATTYDKVKEVVGL
ncbi:dsDNA nuclease domain-containing protein [Weissella sp. MSCH1]|uniref:dsDNA nuclease domain-containing protein n=1 Tax=Weissella sp. MSCH1 TaxID=3383343 RepID=UPI003896E452